MHGGNGLVRIGGVNQEVEKSKKVEKYTFNLFHQSSLQLFPLFSKFSRKWSSDFLSHLRLHIEVASGCALATSAVADSLGRCRRESLI